MFWLGFVLLLLLPSASRVEAQQPEIYFADVPVHVGTLGSGGAEELSPAEFVLSVPVRTVGVHQLRKNHYNRYTRVELEGETWYDVFGSYITRGFGIYSWSQTQPQAFGSDVFKRQQYSSWFNRLVVASDVKGQYHMALTIGDQIRTTLTPLTFSKPAFSGIQWDFLSDKYQLTALASRVSSPGFTALYVEQKEGQTLTSLVNLFGGRGTVQVGDFAKAGIHLCQFTDQQDGSALYRKGADRGTAKF